MKFSNVKIIILYFEWKLIFVFVFPSLFSGYTMDVIASTGFGIQVDSQENPNSPVVKNGRKIFAGDFLKSVMALLSK